MEKTVVLIKPDAVQRSLIGEIISRFEKKGLTLVGMKMMQLDDALLNKHYAHHSDKPFFPGLVKFMKSTPVIAIALEGVAAVATVRTMLGATNSREALPGTVRGDLSNSTSMNMVHASDSVETAEIELARFFKDDEIFKVDKTALQHIYAADEVK